MTENYWHRAKRIGQSAGPLGNFRTVDLYVMRHALCSLRYGIQIQRQVSKIEYRVSNIQHRDNGFTLMEILLSFLILGIVVTTILASFNAVFSTTDTLNSSSRFYDMAKNCLNRMTLDLEAFYAHQPPLYKKPEFDDPPDPYRIVGTTIDAGGTSFASIRFTSGAHLPLGQSKRDGIAEIIYYVQAKNDGQMVLRRADHLYPYPEFEENAGDPVLCTNLKSLVFKYIDDDGSELDGWDSESDEYGYATPAAIRIALVVGDETVSYDFETTVRLAARREIIE